MRPSSPSRHKTTLGQDVRNRFTRFVITRGPRSKSSRGSDDHVVVSAKAVGALHEESWVNAVSSITLPSGETWVEPEMPEPFRAEGWEREIAIVRWPEGVRRPSVKTSAEFRAGARERGLSIPNVSHVLLLPGIADVHAYRVLATKMAQVWQPAVIVLPPTSPRLDLDHAALAGTKSWGRRMRLHRQQDRCDVGAFRSEEVPPGRRRHHAARQSRAPRFGLARGRDSQSRRCCPSNSAGQSRSDLRTASASPRRSGIKRKRRDADRKSRRDAISSSMQPQTRSPSTTFVPLSRSRKTPLVWAEVFGGGFGGLVARHRPGHEPDPASMRRMIEAWCADRGKPIARAANDYGGAEEAPLIADDADVTVHRGTCSTAGDRHASRTDTVSVPEFGLP